MKLIVNAYCLIYACLFLFGKWVWKKLDQAGAYMEYLCDHSDFFAGCVFIYAVMLAYEWLKK